MMKLEKRKGYTLSEVIITLIILSILGTIVALIFNTMFASRDLIDREASIQAEMRVAMQNVNSSVEKASAIFILDDTKYNPSDANIKMTEGWSYIGLSKDGKKILNHVWVVTDEKTGKGEWRVTELGAQSIYDMKLTLNFESETDYQDNRLVKYDVKAQYLDSNNVLELDTAIMALNTKQVFSRVGKGKKGVAIAYRTDPIEGSKKPSVAVSIVFDTSESMRWDMAHKSYSNKRLSRMEVLKEKARDLVKQLEAIGNVHVNVVEFNQGGNYKLENFANLDTDKQKVLDAINSFEPRLINGWTNPGDGLRYGLVSLEKRSENQKYVILLTDGGPNTYRRIRNSREGEWSLNTTDQLRVTRDNENHYAGDGTWEGSTQYRREWDYAWDYTGEVAKAFSKRPKTNIKRISIIGYSGVAEEKDGAKYITEKVNETISAEYRDASDPKSLADAFTQIVEQIKEELWFVIGP